MASPRGGPARGSAIRTFLIADVRGYTRFTAQHGDEAASRLATRFAEVAAEGVEAWGGELVELRGDEALAVFDSPRQALRAAVELQSAFADETAGGSRAAAGRRHRPRRRARPCRSATAIAGRRSTWPPGCARSRRRARSSRARASSTSPARSTGSTYQPLEPTAVQGLRRADRRGQGRRLATTAARDAPSGRAAAAGAAEPPPLPPELDPIVPARRPRAGAALAALALASGAPRPWPHRGPVRAARHRQDPPRRRARDRSPTTAARPSSTCRRPGATGEPGVRGAGRRCPTPGPRRRRRPRRGGDRPSAADRRAPADGARRPARDVPRHPPARGPAAGSSRAGRTARPAGAAPHPRPARRGRGAERSSPSTPAGPRTTAPHRGPARASPAGVPAAVHRVASQWARTAAARPPGGLGRSDRRRAPRAARRRGRADRRRRRPRAGARAGPALRGRPPEDADERAQVADGLPVQGPRRVRGRRRRLLLRPRAAHRRAHRPLRRRHVPGARRRLGQRQVLGAPGGPAAGPRGRGPAGQRPLAPGASAAGRTPARGAPPRPRPGAAGGEPCRPTMPPPPSTPRSPASRPASGWSSWSTSSRRSSTPPATRPSGAPSSTCSPASAPACKVIVAMRADHYGRCAAYPALARLLGSDQVLVGPLSGAELAAVIEHPAQRVGLRVEPELDRGPGRRRRHRARRPAAALDRPARAVGGARRRAPDARRVPRQRRPPGRDRPARRGHLRRARPAPPGGRPGAPAAPRGAGRGRRARPPPRARSASSTPTRDPVLGEVLAHPHRRPPADSGRGPRRGRPRGAPAGVAAAPGLARGGRRRPPGPAPPHRRGRATGRRAAASRATSTAAPAWRPRSNGPPSTRSSSTPPSAPSSTRAGRPRSARSSASAG